MLLLLMLSAAVAPGEGKISAVDDWQPMSIVAVAAQAPNGTHHIRVAAGDLDGDGVADEAILALDCAADGSLTAPRYVIAPRDSSTGMASGRLGKEQKKWLPANFRLQQMKPTYDIKTMKGNERKVSVRGWDPVKKELIDDASWAPISLQDTDGLCPAVAQAAQKATKTRSNIQNN